MHYFLAAGIFSGISDQNYTTLFCLGVTDNKLDGSNYGKAKGEEGTSADQVLTVDSSPTVCGNVNSFLWSYFCNNIVNNFFSF